MNILAYADGVAGQILFENESGFTGNIAGRYVLWKARRRSDTDVTTDIDTSKFGQGLTEIGPVLDKDSIDALQYDRYLEDDDIAHTAEQKGEVIRRRLQSNTFKFSKHLPSVKDAVTDDVLDAMRSYYGSHVKVNSVFLWRNYHAPEGRMWHFDPWATDQVKLFVLLTDTDISHGPTAYLPRSDSIEILKNYSPEQYRTPDSPADNHPEKKYFTGSAGEAAIGNVTQFLHQGTNPEPGNYRDILQIVFSPAAEPLPDNWLEQSESYNHGEEGWRGLQRIFNY